MSSVVIVVVEPLESEGGAESLLSAWAVLESALGSAGWLWVVLPEPVAASVSLEPPSSPPQAGACANASVTAKRVADDPRRMAATLPALLRSLVLGPPGADMRMTGTRMCARTWFVTGAAAIAIACGGEPMPPDTSPATSSGDVDASDGTAAGSPGSSDGHASSGPEASSGGEPMPPDSSSATAETESSATGSPVVLPTPCDEVASVQVSEPATEPNDTPQEATDLCTIDVVGSWHVSAEIGGDDLVDHFVFHTAGDSGVVPLLMDACFDVTLDLELFLFSDGELVSVWTGESAAPSCDELPPSVPAGEDFVLLVTVPEGVRVPAATPYGW